MFSDDVHVIDYLHVFCQALTVIIWVHGWIEIGLFLYYLKVKTAETIYHVNENIICILVYICISPKMNHFQNTVVCFK